MVLFITYLLVKQGDECSQSQTYEILIKDGFVFKSLLFQVINYSFILSLFKFMEKFTYLSKDQTLPKFDF